MEYLLSHTKILFSRIQNVIMKVNTFIVGAPKAGTTSLHHYLNQHADISMSTVKEPNFFSSKEVKSLFYRPVQCNGFWKEDLKRLMFQSYLKVEKVYTIGNENPK